MELAQRPCPILRISVLSLSVCASWFHLKVSHSSSFHSAPDLRGAAAKAREQAKLQAAQFKVEDLAKAEQPRVFSWFGCQASMPRHVACIRKQVLASRPAVRTLTLLLHGLEFCRFPLQAIGGARSVPSGNHSEKALIGCHSITAPLQRAKVLWD